MTWGFNIPGRSVLQHWALTLKIHIYACQRNDTEDLALSQEGKPQTQSDKRTWRERGMGRGTESKEGAEGRDRVGKEEEGLNLDICSGAPSFFVLFIPLSPQISARFSSMKWARLKL